MFKCVFRLLVATLAAALPLAGAQAAQAARAASQAGAQPAQARPIPRAAFLNDMDAEFRKRDADKDGRISRGEMEAFERATSILQLQERNRTLFAKLDADRNGQLSAAEFARLVVPPPAPDVTARMAKFDLDKDKSISLVEYRTGTLANFDRLDQNKDGYVSAAEMKAGGIGN